MSQMKLRSLVEYEKMVDGHIQDYPHVANQNVWHKLVPEMRAAVDFEIVAVISISAPLSANFMSNGKVAAWLRDNTTKRWHLLYNSSGTFVRRIVFEDEGDAFRFAWEHEPIPD